MALTDTEIRRAKPKEKAYSLSMVGGCTLRSRRPAEDLAVEVSVRGQGKADGARKVPPSAAGACSRASRRGPRTFGDWRRPDGPEEGSKDRGTGRSRKFVCGVAARWFEHWKEEKSARHVNSTSRRLESNILPTLGPRQIDEIEAPDIVAIVRAIEARGARDVAKRALETTGQIFRYAIAHGYTRRNPAKEIQPRDILKASVKSNYARIDAKELSELLGR